MILLLADALGRLSPTPGAQGGCGNYCPRRRSSATSASPPYKALRVAHVRVPTDHEGQRLADWLRVRRLLGR